MRLALNQAQAAADAGEVPVGAILVHQERLLASGENRNLRDCDPSAHAELVCLRAGAKALGNQRLNDCTLYCTLEPCPMCAGAIIHARLARLVFGATDPKTGACGTVFDLLESPHHNHRLVVRAGVLAADAGEQLSAFFLKQRGAKDPLNKLRHNDRSKTDKT